MKPILFAVFISLASLQTAPNATGSISGIVIQTGTDRPIDNVQIMITPVTPAQPRPTDTQIGAYTDQLGKFEIAGLTPGRYRLQWQRPGYFTPPVGTANLDKAVIQSLIAQLGTSNLSAPQAPAATSVTVDVAPQQKLTGFVFTLIPGGVISGSVRTPSGTPLVDATLAALAVNYEDGRLVLRPTGTTTSSDDRGNFRLYGLRPGEFYVRVDYRVTSAPSNEVVRVYYPGVTAVSNAIPIAVNEGGESPGANFSMPVNGTVKISGAVFGEAGNAPQYTSSFYLVPASTLDVWDAGSISIPNSATSPGDRTNGKFELRGVSAGEYNLRAVYSDNAQRQTFYGNLSLYVGTQDIENLAIVLHSGYDVNGHLMLEDGSVIRKTLQLRARNTEATIGQIPPMANTTAEGAFVFPKLPDARYSATIPPETADGTCVVDIRQDGKSVYDEGFVAGIKAGSIDVVLSNQCGTIQVQVIGENQKPVVNAFVALVPAMEHRGNPILYRRAQFDPVAARYRTIDLIPPGEYKMFAWELIPPNAELNGTFLAKFEDRGTPVTVKHDDSLTIQLPLISIAH